MVAVAFIQPVLAVDIGEILVGLVALIFVIIRQLLEANKAAGVNRAKPPVVPQPQQPNPLPAPAPAVGQAGQQADPLRAQVEEFLRRAGRPAEQNQPRPPQGKPSEIEVLVKPAQPPEQRVIGQPLRQAEWRKTTTEAASPSTVPEANKPRQIRGQAKSRRRQSVAEHVAEQVVARAENIASKASQLGQRIVAEDRQFEVQVKSKFDHAVGTLAGSATSASSEQTPPAPDTPAAQLAALLANPGGIRQAVLVNEILRRPSERW
jgi:hypothetical protein